MDGEGTTEILEEARVPNFPNVMTVLNIQIQESQETPKQKPHGENYTKSIIIKLFKTSDKKSKKRSE